MSDGQRLSYDEVVERLVLSEARCRLLERTLREYAEVKDQDPSVGSYAVALQARIAGLEKNLWRLAVKREHRHG